MWTMDRNPVTIKIFADVGSFFLKKSSTDKQIHLDAILQRKISPNLIGYQNLLCEPVLSSPVMVILEFWISNFNTFFSAVFFGFTAMCLQFLINAKIAKEKLLSVTANCTHVWGNCGKLHHIYPPLLLQCWIRTLKASKYFSWQICSLYTWFLSHLSDNT